MKKVNINFNLNGEKWNLDVEPSDTLLEMLREKCGVKSPKIGCDRGDCGACTVLLNGKSVRSCLILAPEIDGYEIVTVEGLCKKEPTLLQQTFVLKNSFQCGFCEPGVIMTATELLSKNPKPTKHEIQEAISGNLCRCTGYTQVIEAIVEVASGAKKKGK